MAAILKIQNGGHSGVCANANIIFLETLCSKDSKNVLVRYSPKILNENT